MELEYFKDISIAERVNLNEKNIEYIHIHHVMQKLHDGSGIYTLSM